MLNSRTSIFVFGIYLGITGITLLTVPNLLLGIYSIAATNEVWIRVVGMFGIYLSYYYIQAARTNWTPFYRWTVYTRATVILFNLTFVALRLAEPVFLLLALVDLAGAIWTGLSLRSERLLGSARLPSAEKIS